MPTLLAARDRIRATASACEDVVLGRLKSESIVTKAERELAVKRASELVERLRQEDKPGLMEVFLAEYGLSTDEGIALMCLAEALLRVPDNETIDELIEDKIVSSSWGEHLGKSSSSLVNAATWGLLFTGKVLDDEHQNNIASTLRSAIKRVGEPVIRVAVKRAMKEMGRQFVLGESIESALKRGESQVAQGYSYSFDMLGEAALTENDAARYFCSYEQAIKALSLSASSTDIRDNPGISIKLSALHPRYECKQYERVIGELVPRVLRLAQLAKEGSLGLNIDAEEADRLDLSLDVIQAVLEHPSLAGWDGFGVVVQAYNKCASHVLDWLYALAEENDRRIMVRLVKGAYWDTEIKRAQVEGLRDYPVFTRKSATDISYLCCAKKLLLAGQRIYPQFATHNAHTAAAVLAVANENKGSATSHFEFQRLHGMGEGVFDILRQQHAVRCRIYAPVGRHKDLLAYLVRRLLENGANSSFVNQIVDLEVPVSDVVADPFTSGTLEGIPPIPAPAMLFQPERSNSKGWDLSDHSDLNAFEQARGEYKSTQWQAAPLMAVPYQGAATIKIVNPAKPDEVVGQVLEASDADVEAAILAARAWTHPDAHTRSQTLLKLADLLEQNSGEIFALLAREAGKTTVDVISEIREAVDFLRYYPAQALLHKDRTARGIFVCVSPWNFPLAIFLGQISAALAAGNGVLAKPAETTPLIASFAINLFYQAGVPREVLQLLPGQGSTIGAKLVSAQKVNGVCFTGSTATGLRINKSIAENMAPDTPLIAETGGLNAMIVDSSALPEQAVSDIVNSAFQSAGQRCSALRVLYVQEDIYEDFLVMLFGALDELKLGDPYLLSTDVGPLISSSARAGVQAHIESAQSQGKLLKTHKSGVPSAGYFVAPSVIEVSSIKDIAGEIFGPVLHVAKFKSESLFQVVNDLNECGYGLTFGLHTRIDGRVENLVNRLNMGNIYVNRDQIGAVVGSQPFGGEGLSGTGPKAGGPNYLPRFIQTQCFYKEVDRNEAEADLDKVQAGLSALTQARVKLSEYEMRGPTGESNKLYEFARGVVLCLGPDLESANEQAQIAEQNGCESLIVCSGANAENTINGFLPRRFLSQLSGFSVVALWSHKDDLRAARHALAQRDGKIIPLVCDDGLAKACRLERHVCVDTTAAGGNASLLASAS